jgi:DNA-3-methyladenine glycosylase
VSASHGLREQLAGPVLEVAPRLLNAVLRHGGVAVRITEVEAYAGPDDPGSHAFRGMTRRNEVMFGPAGRLYCYFTYGMHVCCNVTVGPEHSPSAVLLRAGEVIEGVATARERRAGAVDRDLARGPARLCRALAIELTDNGTDLASGRLALELGEPPAEVDSGPRVGLREAADRPWRYWIAGDRTVSPYRRHRLAAPPPQS